MRCSILAGVRVLLGRALGVDGLPREDGCFGEPAGLGEAVRPLGVAGEAGRCRDRGLGLAGGKQDSLWNCNTTPTRILLFFFSFFSDKATRNLKPHASPQSTQT